MHGGGIVMLVEDVTERRNAQARINRMARYDELTGLPNRQSFRDEIAGYLAAGGKSAALLFIDLDQFKQVNDTLGHPAGDKLLCAVTERLREVLGPDDYVARFGGDEFVVFQRNVETREQSAELAARIVDRLSERYEIDHHLIEIGASIGIAVTSSGVGADTLLKTCRHGALPRQGGRPRHLLLLPRGDGRDRRGAPHARNRPAPGARQGGVRAATSSRW